MTTDYRVLHEIPGRIRIQLGSPIFCLKAGRADVEAFFQSVAGVGKASFNPRTGRLLVSYDGNAATRRVLLDRATATAVPAVPRPEPDAMLDKKKKAVIRSGISLLIGPVMPPTVRPLLTLFGALPIFKKGLSSLWRKHLNADVLDSTAIGTAIATRDLTTASLTAFLLKLGSYLEEWARRRFRRHLADMFQIDEGFAWIVVDNQEVRVGLKEVREGDVVVVRTGSLIPVDGVVLEGEAMVSQASLTGESIPLVKMTGRSVYAGTVVEEGAIRIRAVGVGSNTRIAQVVKIIEEAEALKAETQSYSEQMADRLVPYSFLLSGLTYTVTRNPARAAAVLLVDYSCAIKLSTPLAILASLAKSARHNVLIKGGRSLEKLSQANAFILDKTGTLTEATPAIVDVIAFNGYTKDYILQQAACVEEHFPHPVSSAVVRYATQRGLVHEEEHSEVEYILAHGIVSRVHGNRIAVGSRHFVLEDEGVDVSLTEPFVRSYLQKSYSILYVAIGHKVAGILAIRDPLRKDAANFIEGLKSVGIERIIMLTGDSEATASSVARELGIPDYYAQAFPETKVEAIKDLQRQGYTVAMVGDGVNDSPALSHSDVGISMRHGADIAREACDVLLLEGRLEDIFKAREIAQEAMELIKSNYRAIIGINSLGILMAMGGTMPPVLSAALHNLSTIGVALRALKPMRG